MLKDQLEKQPIISYVKNPNFNNVSFKNLLDDKSMKVFDEIRNQEKIIDYSQLNFIGSSKKYIFKFIDFMSLGNLAGNIYSGNILLDAAKQEQREMENMLESFIDKNPIKGTKLESVEVVLVHCNLVKNDYQHASKVLFCFVQNKQFGHLKNISPHSLTMTNTVNTEFSFVEVWFTNQISKALEIEDNVNLTLTVG